MCVCLYDVCRSRLRLVRVRVIFCHANSAIAQQNYYSNEDDDDENNHIARRTAALSLFRSTVLADRPPQIEIATGIFHSSCEANACESLMRDACLCRVVLSTATEIRALHFEPPDFWHALACVCAVIHTAIARIFYRLPAPPIFTRSSAITNLDTHTHTHVARLVFRRVLNRRLRRILRY